MHVHIRCLLIIDDWDRRFKVHCNKNVYFHCLFDDDDGDYEDDDDDEISGKHNHKINIKVNRISMFI